MYTYIFGLSKRLLGRGWIKGESALDTIKKYSM